MSRHSLFVKVTGHPSSVDAAGDLPYLNEITARDNRGFDLLTAAERHKLLGKNRCISIAQPGGKITRLPAQTIRVRGADGIVRDRRTGTISPEYLAHLDELEAQGYQIYQRIITGPKILRHDHGCVLAEPRGTIIPATWMTHVRSQELGWSAALSAPTGMKILARVIRDSIRPHKLVRRTVKTMTGKKVVQTVAAHNLAFAPSPAILAQIKRAGQPVDKVLVILGRHALERMERKRGAQIVAVASTHLQGSTDFRPHLHVRMSAYDSKGDYINLFSRKDGSRGGGRCIMQDDIEREMLRTIERWEQSRGRD